MTAVAAVAVGLSLAAVSPTSAQPEPGPGAADGAGTTVTGKNFTTYTAGRYVVVLAAPSATGYSATRAPAGGQFNAHTPAVRSYSRQLEADHRDLAAQVGATVDEDFTLSTNAFVADLSADQARQLATDRSVLMVAKRSIVHADTWHTPSFLGLTGPDGVWAKAGGASKAGDGVVIGVIDSGIWPEAKSFSGAALSSTPQTKWDISIDGTTTRMEKKDGGVFTGQCEEGEDFTTANCNTKLIGARYYVDDYGVGNVLDADYVSPRDGNGHGTHTSSTAGGNQVKNVKVEGRKFGTIYGMAPGARIAMYKALWATDDGRASGSSIDLLSAVEDAVADGVDVINYSISGPTDTVLDPVEFAFEGAAEAGIFVATSAGNEGPGPSTVAHNDPWVTTVAANTHYNYENTVVLGNGKKYVGASIAGEPVSSHKLVASVDSGLGTVSEADAALCAPDSLDPAKVQGKIVLCDRGVYDRVAKSAEVARAGGVAMILGNVSPNSLDADFHSVPTIHVSDTDAQKIYAYLASAGNSATAKFVLGNQTNHQTPVPQIAGFSSRGPAASDNGDLLKPDISAPGVSVLAAVAPPSNEGRKFDLYSGTSMSSPHIAGLAAVLAGLKPSWTPQQIKSAMMTTATNLKTEDGKNSRDLFAEGAGMVTPTKFLDPGLFVTSTPQEWLGYLAGLGVPTGADPVEPRDINLPSLAQGYVMAETDFTRTFRSSRAGTWDVKVRVPGFDATSSSPTLVAKRAGDIESLDFHFERTTAALSEYAFGYITLTGPTTVRLPVALRPVSVKAPESVGGTGTTGAVDVPITGGFTGDLTVGTQGLVKGQVFEGGLAEGDYTLECATIGEGSTLARFDLHAPDPTSDLDMYVYASDSCDPNDIYAVAGQSATPSAGETVTLTDPPAGSYIIEVDAYAAGNQGEPVPYSLRVFDVGGSPAVGDLTITPQPVPVVTGQDTSFEASWSGLDPDSIYLGLLTYDGAPNPTYLYVDTTTP
ncbi:MAG TPA: S8 family serine peptidase [Nocardioides sp.]|nr:S8 family serine peptidase [Nocardioides sp.]